MTSIKLTVIGAQAQASVTGPLTSGMVGIPVTIEYDEAWDGLTKNLMCRCSPWGSNDGENRAILNVGETAAVAHEVMQADTYLYLGVEGFNDDGTLVMPTTWACCGKIAYGANTSEDPSTDPSLSVWNQLQIEMEQTKEYVLTPEQAVNIQAYAREARQAAEEAKQTAENGLYYTPVVTQPTDSTLKFEFQPSVTGAPSPNPVTVELPSGEDSGQKRGALMQKPQTTILNNVQDSTTYKGSGVTEDTTNKILWDKSVNVSGSGSYIRFHKNYSPFSLDMKNNHLVIKIKINSIDDGAYLMVKVADASGVLVPYTLVRKGKTTIYGEWQEFTLSYKAYVNSDTPSDLSTIDFENISEIYIISTNGACDFNVQFVGYRPNQLSKGIVTFTFDDGYKSVIDGIKALAERGATGTVYVIEGATSEEYMSVAEMQELAQLYGTDFEAHGSTEYQNMTDAELIDHWVSTKQYLIENGLGSGEHLAYPGGMNPARVYQLAKKYFRTARTINDTSRETFPPYDVHRIRAISGVSQNATWNVAKIKEFIDKTAESNAWLILVFHKIDDGTDTTSMYCSMDAFEEIVDYAVNSDVRIMNMAEVFDTDAGGTNAADILTAVIDALPVYNGEVE